VFPLFWLAFASRSWSFGKRLIYLAIAVTVLVLLGTNISVYFVIWLIGCLVWLLPECTALHRTGPRRFASTLAGGGFLLALSAVRILRGWNEFAVDLLVGASFAVLLYCLKHNRLLVNHPTLRRSVATFADFSYTLYPRSPAAANFPQSVLFLRIGLAVNTLVVG